MLTSTKKSRHVCIKHTLGYTPFPRILSVRCWQQRRRWKSGFSMEAAWKRNKRWPRTIRTYIVAAAAIVVNVAIYRHLSKQLHLFRSSPIASCAQTPKTQLTSTFSSILLLLFLLRIFVARKLILTCSPCRSRTSNF